MGKLFNKKEHQSQSNIAISSPGAGGVSYDSRTMPHSRNESLKRVLGIGGKILSGLSSIGQGTQERKKIRRRLASLMRCASAVSQK